MNHEDSIATIAMKFTKIHPLKISAYMPHIMPNIYCTSIISDTLNTNHEL